MRSLPRSRMYVDLAIQALGPSSRRSIVAARKDMPHLGLVRKWQSVSISHTSTTQLSKTGSIVGLSLTAELQLMFCSLFPGLPFRSAIKEVPRLDGHTAGHYSIREDRSSGSLV
jgi:hypothetical protein